MRKLKIKGKVGEAITYTVSDEKDAVDTKNFGSNAATCKHRLFEYKKNPAAIRQG